MEKKYDSENKFNSNVNKIETFVFFDLETTGMNARNRILELSMVAVSRNDLLNMKNLNLDFKKSKEELIFKSPSKCGPPNLPRVVHKYTRLYYPRALIHPNIEDITGLSNDALHHLSQFSESDAEALNLFLNLPAPVSLVAHNGNAFDFPILKAELMNVKTDLREGILCVDTLLCVRELQKIAYQTEINISSQIAESFDASNLTEENLPPKMKANESIASSSFTYQSLNLNFPTHQNCEMMWSEAELLEIQKCSEIACDFDKFNNQISKENCFLNDNNFLTPEKSSVNYFNSGAKTPSKSFAVNGIFTPEPSPSTSGIENCTLNKKSVKRALIFGSKTPFSQPILYERLFGSKYNAHCAEGDAISLLQICGFYGEEFLNWADENNKDFKIVSPRWSSKPTRISFNL